jgi:hypothetical protein
VTKVKAVVSILLAVLVAPWVILLPFTFAGASLRSSNLTLSALAIVAGWVLWIALVIYCIVGAVRAWRVGR